LELRDYINAVTAQVSNSVSPTSAKSWQKIASSPAFTPKVRLSYMIKNLLAQNRPYLCNADNIKKSNFIEDNL